MLLEIKEMLSLIYLLISVLSGLKGSAKDIVLDTTVKYDKILFLAFSLGYASHRQHYSLFHGLFSHFFVVFILAPAF